MINSVAQFLAVKNNVALTCEIVIVFSVYRKILRSFNAVGYFIKHSLFAIWTRHYRTDFIEANYF